VQTQDVPQAPESDPLKEPEPSLLDDLLETSERIFHRDTARKQRELQAKREEATNEARA
jgi:hypothetical protein